MIGRLVLAERRGRAFHGTRVAAHDDVLGVAQMGRRADAVWLTIDLEQLWPAIGDTSLRALDLTSDTRMKISETG